MAEISKERLKKLELLIEIAKNKVTRADFVKSFEVVLKQVLLIEENLIKKADEKTESTLKELSQLKKDFESVLDDAKRESEGTFSSIRRKTLEKIDEAFARNDVANKLSTALGAVNEKLRLVDEKLSEIKSGTDGTHGKDGKDADEELIIQKVLASIPPPPKQETILPPAEAIRDSLETLIGEDRLRIKAIENLEEELEEIRKIKGQRPIFGGSNSSFLSLLDTPNIYTGHSGKVVSVKSDERSLEFTTPFTQATADARYLMLDTSNDPLTGTLSWSSALDGGTPISFPDSAGVDPTIYTMHVGGGEFSASGAGIFNQFNIEFTPNSDAGSYNQIQFLNTTAFQIVSHITGTSFNLQESGSTWSFASDQNLVFAAVRTLTFNTSQSTNTLTNLTRVGTTATATYNGHGYSVGDWVTIVGANDANFNGTFLVATRTANTFTYTMAGTPAASPDPNVGSITVVGGVDAINFHGINIINAASQDITVVSNNGTNLIHTRGVNYANPASPVATGVGNIYFGSTHETTPTAFFNTLIPAIANVPANTNFFISQWDNLTTSRVTIPTGTATLIGNMRLSAPAFTMTGSSTDSPTLYIEGAPTKGSGSGTLGNARPLLVDSGVSRFDDGIILAGNTGVTLTATTGGVLTLAGTGNTNNENITLDFETTANEVKLGTGTGVTALKFDVQPQTKAGTSTSYAKVGGKLSTNTTTVGNITTGEDNLMTYSVPANALSTNGDTIRFYASGTFAATGNAKQLKVYFGSTVILTPTADGGTAQDVEWVIDGEIIRTGSATQKVWARFQSYNATASAPVTYMEYTTPTETLSGAVTLKLTGEATATDDIKQETMTVDWLPA